MIAAILAFAPLLQGAPSSGASPGGASSKGAEAAAYEDALASARERLPERLRVERVERVRLERRPDLGVPAAAPLALRLFGRGTLAFHDPSEGVIVLTDAGASGRATWSGAAPEPADVAAFLARLAPALDPAGGPPLDASARWARFRARVAAWGGEPLRGGPGDVGVLDAFLAEAPWRALGGRASVEALLVHELAHAVQLGDEGFPRRVLAWSAVTGWRERADGSLADGLAGEWITERPAALVRMLLGGPRGASEFDPGEGGDSLYARFDPREDFAEAVRAMAYAPARLARESPARFMAVNATGWVADLDAGEPGPLWRDADAVGEDAMASTVERGARALLARWADSGGDVDPAAFAAVLDAHRAFIPADLVAARAPLDVAADLPDRVAATAARASFRVADGSRRSGPEAAVRAVIERSALDHADLVAYTEGFASLLDGADREAWERAIGELAALPLGRERLDRTLLAVRMHGGDLRDKTVRDRVLAEIDAFHGAGLPWLAMRLRVVGIARLGRAAGPGHAAATLRGALETVEERVAAEGPCHDAVECCVDAARALARLGREDLALEAIARAPGETWGAFRRSVVTLELGERGRAEAAARRVQLAGLRDRALLDVAGAHAAAGEVERARALLAEVRDTGARERALEGLGG